MLKKDLKKQKEKYEERENKTVSVTQEIEDGSFFKKGLEWYMAIFLFSSSEKVFLFYYTIVTIITLSISTSAIFYTFPTIIDMQVMYFNNDSERIARPIRLNSETNSSSASSLAKYLVENYVKERESYSYEEIDSRVAYIDNNSSRAVFREYYDNYIGEKNRHSTLLLLQDKCRRQASIKSVKIINDSINDHPYKAELEVSIKESNLELAQEKKIIAEIVVEFDMPTLSFVKNDYLDFFFTVTSYDLLSLREDITIEK